MKEVTTSPLTPPPPKMNREQKRPNNVPYRATIVPLPDGLSFASFTASFRSAINVSATGTVKRCEKMIVKEVRLESEEFTHRTRNVNARSSIQCIQMPAPCGHLVSHLVNVHLGVLRCERNHRCGWVAKKIQLGDRCGDTISYVSRACDN